MPTNRRTITQLKTSFAVFYKVFSELCVSLVFVSLVVQKSVHYISKHTVIFYVKEEEKGGDSS